MIKHTTPSTTPSATPSTTPCTTPSTTLGTTIEQAYFMKDSSLNTSNDPVEGFLKQTYVT